jgi:hypothetical protein
VHAEPIEQIAGRTDDELERSLRQQPRAEGDLDQPVRGERGRGRRR